MQTYKPALETHIVKILQLQKLPVIQYLHDMACNMLYLLKMVLNITKEVIVAFITDCCQIITNNMFQCLVYRYFCL